ncbi:MAG: glycoside hydrolase family 31 protein, partial [Castellaniella sp.]|nr:glycoside hydrolase family 31 protein [Castellaniella sp.]
MTTPSCVEWAFHADEWRLRIEAHAPGVFRLRCGPRAWLEPGKPTLRMQRQADMLLARQEPVGEMECQAVASGGWRLTQGEAILEIGSATGLRLFRSDRCVAQARLPIRTSIDDEDLWALDWVLDPAEGLYGLGESQASLDRRGACLVSDLPADRALPLAWGTGG